MSGSTGSEFDLEAADIIGEVRKKGVRLWSENGNLHFKAPKGALTRPELDRLSVCRDRIVTALRRSSDDVPTEYGLEPRRHAAAVPVSFTQLAHWLAGGFADKPSCRHLAVLTRLHGSVDVERLRQSLAAVVQRHEALRTRIVAIDGKPWMEVVPEASCELAVHDLSTLQQDERERELRVILDRARFEPIRVTEGPLFCVHLAALGTDEYALLVAMDHMISDAQSVNILLRDLLACYRQSSQASPVGLSGLPIQFADYADWLQRSKDRWLERDGPYWEQRIGGCERLRFPERGVPPPVDRAGWGTVPLSFGQEFKAELLEWCRTYRATPVMAVFTAYAAAVLRWCESTDAVFRFQTDGRWSPKTKNAIGYFASVLNLRIVLRAGDSFRDLMQRITEEYCAAHDHSDHGYLDTATPKPAVLRNTLFNWVPLEPRGDTSLVPGAPVTSPSPLAPPAMHRATADAEPLLLLYETDTGVSGGIHFALNRLQVETMDRFGHFFTAVLTGILQRPDRRVSDFPLP